MAFFQFGKKKEKEEKVSGCSCSCGCGSECGASDSTTCCSEVEHDGVCSVKVLGSGCKACHELYQNAQKAVQSIGIPGEVEYITDMQKVMEYGVMSMPALVVNEKVVAMGKVLKADDVVDLLKKLGF